jgi:hypothetical protein
MISREKEAAILRLLATGIRSTRVGLARASREAVRSVVSRRRSGDRLSRHVKRAVVRTTAGASEATGIAEPPSVPIERVFRLLKAPLGVDLKPEHRRRYEQIRAKNLETLRAKKLKERARHDRRVRKREQSTPPCPTESERGDRNNQ